MSKKIAFDSDAKGRSDDVITNEEKDFSSLNLDERILAGISKAGYKIPSQVQREVIPLCLTSSDVLVQEKSGTNDKMLVFSIIALTAVLEAEDLQVLIISPTREGAFQIHTTINSIGSKIQNLKCECFIGGFSFIDDVSKTDKCNIAVGTPGRISHLIRAKKLKIDTLRLFVLDDFDLLHYKHMIMEINEFIDALPVEKQTIVTSLTCPDDVLRSASEYLKPSFLTCNCENETQLLLGMDHYYHLVPIEFMRELIYRRKLEVLKKILSQVKFSQCIIFCRCVSQVEVLHVDILNCGFSVAYMTNTIDQVERLQALELLKRNKCKLFITTDMGSRSLESKNVDLIVNFDAPENGYAYLHRSGRAAKNGVKSTIITLLTKNQKALFIQLKKEVEFESYELSRLISKDLISNINPIRATSQPSKQLNSGRDSLRNIVKKCNRQKHSEAGERGSLLTDKKDGGSLFMTSKTVAKSAHKLKSTSETSKKVLHKAFDEVHLKREENCSKSSNKLPPVTSKKKYCIGNIEERCKMKPSSQVNFGPFVTKPQSCTEHLKCGKHSCINGCSRSSAIQLDKHPRSYLSGRENSFPVEHNFIHGHHIYQHGNSKLCYPSYQHCSFTNCSCHHPFGMYYK